MSGSPGIHRGRKGKLRVDKLTYRFRGLDVRLTNQGGKVVTKLLA
jgi:hypothetical protein